METEAGVSTITLRNQGQAYRRMSVDSTQSVPQKNHDKRHLKTQYALVIILTILVSLAVSLAIVYTLRPKVILQENITGAPAQSARSTESRCQKGNGGCADQCTETASGGVKCSCQNPGMKLSLNGKSCQDIDECLSSSCGPDMECINTLGSHICIHTKLEGSTYVRWGRTTCSQNIGTEAVYSGYAAGQFYSQSGGASNYLCLPEVPEWGDYSKATNKTEKRNFISGAEFEKEGEDPFPFSSKNTKTLNNQDAPCVVCRPERRSSVLMIPAKISCFDGWTLEYTGYLMSEFFQDSRTEFICMDKDPQVTGSGHENLDGAGLFLVEAMCGRGSLQCPPYEPDRELACVVCSK